MISELNQPITHSIKIFNPKTNSIVRACEKLPTARLTTYIYIIHIIDKISYSRVQKSIENFVFRLKMAIFRRAGMREGGRVATPTSISIFDSYDIKSL